MEAKTQVVEFELAGKVFATQIHNVREIVEKPDVTELPNTPDCVEGVINLRGETATLLNPKPILNVGNSVKGNRLLVTESDGDTTGILVDSVNEVYQISDEDLQDIDDFDEEETSQGVFRTENSNKDDFVVLIDIGRMEADVSKEVQQRT
ncbi:chemotaxis protein CheW [Haladaptatus sp. F3-133]|uniref:Chemotaxis protein CheW n=1 Tax=Halorutilus salinus TaxID=2487751 RepID=A0A9Q4C3Q7_9EURY|nr:chemotaxis protein CheW [Halorutilus salinus]MCX2818414.1 chemotaxis protein CheW [Halorutilus salinus]